jgi:hypothetical protein
MSLCRRVRHLPSVLIPLLLCSACASSAPPVITRLQLEKLPIPAALLECQPDPDIPERMGDRELADYVITLWQAGDDCRAKLATVRGLAQ